MSLRLEHIDGERRQVRVVKGKGAKDRYVELPECLLHLLRQYYKTYRPQVYLFNGKVSGEPWAKRSAQWSIQHARSTAGIERAISPHVLRHCYATHHLEHGTNLVSQYPHLCKRYEQQVKHPIAGMDIHYLPQIR